MVVDLQFFLNLVDEMSDMAVRVAEKLAQLPTSHSSDLLRDKLDTLLHGEKKEDESFNSLRCLFDSHCHLDRILDKYQLGKARPFQTLRNSKADEFSPYFEGCIANFCDPERFSQNEVFLLLAPV